MGPLFEALAEGFRLLFSFDREVYTLVGTSFRIAASSTIIASVTAFPLGTWFGLADFRGRKVVDVILNTMLFFPTVVVGHLVYMFLTHDGPLGEYRLLFTRTAIVIGQVILATPIILTMVSNSVRQADPRIIKTALYLGAGKFRAYMALLGEVRGLVLLSLLAAFGRVISEIGVSMMLGGNISGRTRTITTGIALLTSQGEFTRATALGIVLLIIVFGVNLAVYHATHRAAR
jgi:tungstate transport system permease protein